jgi:hypothetical protein
MVAGETASAQGQNWPSSDNFKMVPCIATYKGLLEMAGGSGEFEPRSRSYSDGENADVAPIQNDHARRKAGHEVT